MSESDNDLLNSTANPRNNPSRFIPRIELNPILMSLNLDSLMNLLILAQGHGYNHSGMGLSLKSLE